MLHSHGWLSGNSSHITGKFTWIVPIIIGDIEPSKIFLTIGHSFLCITVKGTLTRDVQPLFFFHKSTPSRPQIHGLKPFWIWLRIREGNRLWKRRFSSQLCQLHLRIKTVCRIIREDIRKKFGFTAVSLTQLCNQLCWKFFRIWSHIWKGFNLCIRDPGEVVWWKKTEVENLVSGSL
jgi:hypothetical protein